MELKTGFRDDGPATISWVSFSKTWKTVYYRDRTLHRLPYGSSGGGNHYDAETGEKYWVSGVKKDGNDRHSSGRGPVVIDEDAREEYERLTGRGSDGQ